ncbi:hypothetical protein L9F63_002145, partial [Diploptera punctata]
IVLQILFDPRIPFIYFYVKSNGSISDPWKFFISLCGLTADDRVSQTRQNLMNSIHDYSPSQLDGGSKYVIPLITVIAHDKVL